MDSAPNAEVSPVPVPPIPATGNRRILFALLSAILPGAGHLSLGKTRTGVAFLCAFCLLMFMFWPLRLPRAWIALQALTLALITLCTMAAWHGLRTPSTRVRQGSRAWLLLLIPFGLLVAFGHDNWLLRAAGLRPFTVPSTGMEPTILKGDRIVVDLRQYRGVKPKVRDIIVIGKDGLFFVKRVGAVGGDLIQGKNAEVVLNGERLEESYIQHVGDPPLELKEFGPVKVPPGKLFLLGDNRDVALDSRMPEFGLVDEQSVAGRALYVMGSQSRKDGRDLR